MPTVILPLGYPEQSGSFDTIVYQGNLVRSYSLPTDPRTNNQVFTRYQWRDFNKTLSTAGPFARDAIRAAITSHWHTVLIQYLRADVNGAYTAALSAWNALSPTLQAAWAIAAPFQATYNDPGKIFCILALCTRDALIHYSEFDWLTSGIVSTDPTAAASWWTAQLSNYFLPGHAPNSDSRFDVTALDVQLDPLAFNGRYLQGSITPASQSISCFFFGRYLLIRYLQNSDSDTAELLIDGHSQGQVAQQAADTVYNCQTISDLFPNSLHHFWLRSQSGNINFDSLEVYGTAINKVAYLVTADGFQLVTDDGHLLTVR